MVQLKIKNESELYNRFDPLKNRISEDVYHYLKSYCTERQSQMHALDVIRIITDEPIDEDHFKMAVQNAAGRDCEEFDSQISRNKNGFQGICHGYFAKHIGCCAFTDTGPGPSGNHFVIWLHGHK